MRLMIPLTLVMLSLFGGAAGAASIDTFMGRWDGHRIEIAGDDIPLETISIEIVKQNNGFQLSWKDLARNDEGKPSVKALKVRFVRSNREDVFELAPESGSFLDRMFASPYKGNPLEGETLLWARIDNATLAVYSLTIDNNGGFNLDHYAWTRTEDGLDLRFREQSEELDKELTIEGQLVQAGG